MSWLRKLLPEALPHIHCEVLTLDLVWRLAEVDKHAGSAFGAKVMRLLLVSKAILREKLFTGGNYNVLPSWINQKIAVPGANGAIAAIHSGVKKRE